MTSSLRRARRHREFPNHVFLGLMLACSCVGAVANASPQTDVVKMRETEEVRHLLSVAHLEPDFFSHWQASDAEVEQLMHVATSPKETLFRRLRAVAALSAARTKEQRSRVEDLRLTLVRASETPRALVVRAASDVLSSGAPPDTRRKLLLEFAHSPRVELVEVAVRVAIRDASLKFELEEVAQWAGVSRRAQRLVRKQEQQVQYDKTEQHEMRVRR